MSSTPHASREVWGHGLELRAEPPSANFFSHIKLSKCAYYWRFSHINLTSDSDSIKVIIMAKIHCHIVFDTACIFLAFMGALPGSN